MKEKLRVAFFPDSYLEVNGAAMTCQRLVNFARDKGRPMLCVHAGPETAATTEGSVTHFSLKRSPLAIPLDEGLAFDPLFSRHTRKIRKALVDFKPDIIHITGINDVSNAAAYLAWKMGIPMLGSWHTNVHEFASSRLQRMFRFLPKKILDPLARMAEFRIMQGCILYYQMPKVILAPNNELVSELGRRTKRPARLMARGVDSAFFSPSKRTVNDGILRVGFVGRLRAEKNVKLLIDVERAMLDRGLTNFKFLIVGEGNVREHLEENMKTAEFTGFLSGEELAAAYANMDIFLFPSETDAFGNVAQEANASGVPAIVTDKGGPKFIIEPGVNGLIARDPEEFIEHTIRLASDPELLASMKSHSRDNAVSRSWDSIFEGVYDAYLETIEITEKHADEAHEAKQAKRSIRAGSN
ncbi:MAG: glycosyltransferase [Acidobacteria bacterium]|nr:glycosyltransferase [Acidobacteriota bacterium]